VKTELWSHEQQSNTLLTKEQLVPNM